MPEKNGFAISDSEGLFEMEMMADWWDGVLAYDADRKYGGIVYVPRNKTQRDIALIMNPLVSVTGQVVSKSPGFKLKRANIAIYSAPDDKGHTMILSSGEVDVDLLLPPGRYKAQVTAGTKMGGGGGRKSSRSLKTKLNLISDALKSRYYHGQSCQGNRHLRWNSARSAGYRKTHHGKPSKENGS